MTEKSKKKMLFFVNFIYCVLCTENSCFLNNAYLYILP